MIQVGPYAPAAPFGPKSFKLSNQIRYQVAKLSTTQVQLQTVLLATLLAFVFGFVIAIYGPLIAETQRGTLSRLLAL